MKEIVHVGIRALTAVQPAWEGMVNRRLLTTDERSRHHLLAQIFGDFEEGAKALTTHSGLSLEELSIRPKVSRDSVSYQGEALTLVRMWHASFDQPEQVRRSA